MIAEETRSALLDKLSDQFAYTHRGGSLENADVTHDVDAANEPVLADTTSCALPAHDRQDHQAQTEEVASTSNGAQIPRAESMLYDQAQSSEEKEQLKCTNERIKGDEAAFGQNSPDDGCFGTQSISNGAGNHPPHDVGSPTAHIHSICPTGCQCACHASRNYGSWSVSWLEKALGSVLVSHHGALFGQTACTDFRCLASQVKPPKWLRASYTPPPWLSQMTLYAFVSLGPPTPELLLRVVNQIPNVSSPEAFWNLKGIVERGDVEALKFSIANRLASVHDVHHATGATALWYAIHVENYEMVKILLHAGADPFQGSVSNAAVAMLLRRIDIGSPRINKIASLFSVADIMDAYEYTDLHRIILGNHPPGTFSAVARSPVLLAQVNQPTVAGLTPVHLAAMRGNTAQLATLRQAGADISFRAVNKSTALHLACLNQKSSAARFILDAERVPDRTTSIGMTPLHCIVSTPRVMPEMWEVADRLLELGADIACDARTTCDVTPLMYAANADSPEAISYLLSRGASIDTRDTDGDTALAEAIFSNSPECIRVLLDRGADVEAVNKYGRGTLHYLAGAGSEDIIDIFHSTGALTQKNLDKHAVDRDGLDAMHVLNRRPSLSAELREKFQRLLDNIPDYVISELDDDVWKDCCSVSEMSEDEYFDAKDSQEW